MNINYNQRRKIYSKDTLVDYICMHFLFFCYVNHKDTNNTNNNNIMAIKLQLETPRIQEVSKINIKMCIILTNFIFFVVINN